MTDIHVSVLCFEEVGVATLRDLVRTQSDIGFSPLFRGSGGRDISNPPVVSFLETFQSSVSRKWGSRQRLSRITLDSLCSFSPLFRGSGGRDCCTRELMRWCPGVSVLCFEEVGVATSWRCLECLFCKWVSVLCFEEVGVATYNAQHTAPHAGRFSPLFRGSGGRDKDSTWITT